MADLEAAFLVGHLRYWKGKRKRRYFLCAGTVDLQGTLSKTEKVNPEAFQTLFTSVCQCLQFHKEHLNKRQVSLIFSFDTACEALPGTSAGEGECSTLLKKQQSPVRGL